MLRVAFAFVLGAVLVLGVTRDNPRGELRHGGATFFRLSRAQRRATLH